jgi:hypothetical protein
MVHILSPFDNVNKNQNKLIIKVRAMPLYENPHKNHEKHLCNLVAEGTDLSDYKDLVRNSKFVCRNCGRSAGRAENLCDPVPL